MMRFILIFFLYLNLFSTEKNVKSISHFSKYLQKEQKLNIYIPNSKGPHSVLYLLHGAWGNYLNWFDKTEIENYADQFNFIIVMPDGGEFSWYIDSPVRKNWNYESYFIKELIPFVDSNFNTIKNKNGRAICGLSMGGFGALHFGAKHPQLFSSASSLSGVLNIKKYAGQKQILDTAFGSVENKNIWNENDLFLIVENFRNQVEIKFDIGLEDKYLIDNREFSLLLQSKKIPFSYTENLGPHDWNYWNKHIREHLDFHSNYLSNSRKTD